MTATIVPALDLSQLDSAAARPAPTLTAIEHRDMATILDVALPGVIHHRDREVDTLMDEHWFVEAGRGSAVKAVLRFDRGQGRTLTTIAEIGGSDLWARIVAACTEWESAGRRTPDHWIR